MKCTLEIFPALALAVDKIERKEIREYMEKKEGNCMDTQEKLDEEMKSYPRLAVVLRLWFSSRACIEDDDGRVEEFEEPVHCQQCIIKMHTNPRDRFLDVIFTGESEEGSLEYTAGEFGQIRDAVVEKFPGLLDGSYAVIIRK
ncbi:MAG: hypothetical protein ACI4HI_05340 [Lachnospiraceae bacterium]